MTFRDDDRRDRALAALGGIVCALALVLGGPLFLRMPPWCDLTLYQVAAANVQAGGVLYRDVFDTNLPGFIAALTLVRMLFGPSVEAVRAVDLVVVGLTAAGLIRWVRAGGSGRAGAAWLAAGLAWFYLFTSEFNHCQRDVWMLLPAVAAAGLRTRRLLYAQTRLMRPALLEGFLWGLAVWIKPHGLIPAAAVWLITLPRLKYLAGWRGLVLDTAGYLIAGGTVGALGVLALIASGTWPHFLETFSFWNSGYAAAMWRELDYRARTQFLYFPPWIYLHTVAIPVAMRSIWDARFWSGAFRTTPARGPVGNLSPQWLWDAGPTDTARFARLTLAVLYLAWTAQALLVQRGFHYVHVPEVFLLLAVLATQRWMPAAFVLVWLGYTTLLVRTGQIADQTPMPAMVKPDQPHPVALVHPFIHYDRWAVWPDCFRTGLSDEEYYERWARLALVRDFFPANDWPELAEIMAELRKRGATDGDVICWHDAPHAVYALLPTRPGFRFQHVTAMMAIGPAQEARVWEELEAVPPGPRWAISDLHRVGYLDQSLLKDADWGYAGPDLLPPGMSHRARRMFPNDQPAIFRSGNGRGRYVLHAITRPLRRPY